MRSVENRIYIEFIRECACRRAHFTNLYQCITNSNKLSVCDDGSRLKYFPNGINYNTIDRTKQPDRLAPIVRI